MTTTLDLLSGQENLRHLMPEFETHDITFPGLDEWNTLQGELLPDPEPKPPTPVLDTPVEELHEWARKLAAHRLATKNRNEYSQALNRLAPILENEIKAKIRENADSILDQLRPQFDVAANGLRAGVAVGVKPDDTMDSLFRESLEVRDAWLLSHGYAKTLDAIFEFRQLLSVVAGVAPTMEQHNRFNYERGMAPSRIDWNVTILDPKGGLNLEPYNSEVPWRRWIRVAPHLRLA